MPKPEDDPFDRVVGGIERLQVAYSLERMVYLGGVVVGILLLTFFSIMTAFGKLNRDDWLFLFGPSGLFLGTCAGSMIHFKKALEIVDRHAGGRDGAK